MQVSCHHVGVPVKERHQMLFFSYGVLYCGVAEFYDYSTVLGITLLKLLLVDLPDGKNLVKKVSSSWCEALVDVELGAELDARPHKVLFDRAVN